MIEPMIARKSLVFAVSFLMIFGFASLLEAAELKVAATISPVADMIQEISGDETKVVTILPPGANPHTFELTPKLIKELDGSEVIFRIGKNFDDWITGISENLPSAQLVQLSENMQTISGDPHYWLSIENAKVMAKQIAETLIQIDPSNEAKYQIHLNHYLEALNQAGEHIKEALSSLPQKKIVTFHDGWRYLARDYGLEVVATVESSEGNEPTPKRLAKLHGIIKKHDIRVLFTEPTAPKSLAHSIARDFDLQMVELDPLGFKTENKTFIQLMLHNADEIKEVLKKT